MITTTIPRATARLQLHRGFTLDDAAGVVAYYAKLGVSHLYTSPLLTARPGSLHGYDIVDHGAVNPELGGEDALRRLVEELRRHRMGLIADIVPNHMGVGGADNAWWLDLLEKGKASRYTLYFDIDWDAPGLENKVLAPFLGEAPAAAARCTRASWPSRWKPSSRASSTPIPSRGRRSPSAGERAGDRLIHRVGLRAAGGDEVLQRQPDLGHTVRRRRPLHRQSRSQALEWDRRGNRAQLGRRARRALRDHQHS